MPFDPRICRARLEIAGDRALLKQLTEPGTSDGVPPSKPVQARVKSLVRLITANERLIERLKD